MRLRLIRGPRVYAAHVSTIAAVASRERISSNGTRLLAPLIAGLGVLIVVRTVAAGGGALSAGVLLGLVFVGIGLGRLYLLHRPRG
jgi:multisubunit Na+/H+ antiporter MnhB subunit